MDALLLAGDLYDNDQTSMKTARFLVGQLDRLRQAGIRVFLIRGNHDAESRISRELTFPDNVKLFEGRAEAVPLERPRGALPVVIHGISFAQPKAPESLVPKFRPLAEDSVNIGLLHTSLTGSEGHDPYAPCTLAELHGTGFRYWALGHIHKRFTEAGPATIVMPGIPQGRDVGEAGAKGVTLVTVGDDGTIALEERSTSLAQFERVTVDVAGCEDWRAMLSALDAALGRARDAAPSRHLVARPRLVGATELHWRLRRDPDLLLAEAQTCAGRHRNLWIDKLELACAPPTVAGPVLEGGIPIDELARLMDEAAGSDAFLAEIREIADELAKALRPELRNAFGEGEAAQHTLLADCAREGIADMLARLRGAPGSEQR